jgi:hypothetical protein
MSKNGKYKPSDWLISRLHRRKDKDEFPITPSGFQLSFFAFESLQFFRAALAQV